MQKSHIDKIKQRLQLPTKQQLQKQEIEEEQAQLSKLQNITNNMKQIILHISATFKQADQIKDQAKSVINAFDKSLDEYNLTFLRLRSNRLTYFKIDPFAVHNKPDIFIKPIDSRIRYKYKSFKSIYILNLVFSRDQESNWYRMHPQIWKKDGEVTTTNKILTKYERNCVNYLSYYLNSFGFVSHYEGLAIVLQSARKVNLQNGPNQQRIGSTQTLMKAIYEYSSRFLDEMIQNICQEVPCKLCNMFLLYEAKQHMLMPPTQMQIMYEKKDKDKDKDKDKQKERKVISEQKNKNFELVMRMYHEPCILYDLKGPKNR